MAIKYTEMATELAPSQVKKFAQDEFPEAQMGDYNALGLSVAQDADVDAVLSQTGFTPLQYLQFPLGKPVEVMTTPATIDKIAGRSVVADWETENVIQPVIEGVGVPQLYGDDNDAPLASMQYDYELRTVQRFELASRIGRLEDARLSKMGVLGYKSPFEAKRNSVANGMKLLLDEIGFRGFINGSGVTEGLLTDHNKLAAISAASVTVGGSTETEWSKKNYDQICADIRAMFGTLATQTDAHFDGMAGDKCKLVLSPASKNALTTVNSFGKTVLEFIKDNYEGCEIVATPRFTNAFASGVNGAMLIADELNGNEVVKQYVPCVMRLLGIEKRMKYAQEDYTFATAGVMVKQPLGIVTMINI